MEPFPLAAGPLLLDQPTEADVDAITEYCQDPVFERFLTLPSPYARRAADDRAPKPGWPALRVNDNRANEFDGDPVG